MSGDLPSHDRFFPPIFKNREICCREFVISIIFQKFIIQMMKYFLAICSCFTFLQIYSQSAIIGGKEIEVATAPWTANIRIVNLSGVAIFDRSGVIVSENLILTASHNWPDYDCDHIAAHVGGANSNEGKYHRVHRVIHHPEYDLTLLELSEPLKFNRDIQPVDYKSCADESLYTPGTCAVVYGWGTTAPNAPITSLELRSANVKIIPPSEAGMISGRIDAENVIVSKGETKISMAGKGDSGGPLIVFDACCKPVLAGITILADTRAASQNSSLTVYAKVKPAVKWIDANKCEITGVDTVSPFGATFEIANIPPDVKSVKWTYSGLTEIHATANRATVISSEIMAEASGTVSAAMITDAGSTTVTKNLTIMPRIDIDVSVKYNATAAKYEMTIKPLNMGAIDDDEMWKCKNIVDNTKLLGFIWTYDGETAIGDEAIFEINPHSPKIHTVNVSKHDCDYVMKLNKSFTFRAIRSEFVDIRNEPGTITVGGVNLSESLDTAEELKMTYSKNAVENSLSLKTSPVTVEKPYRSETRVESGNYTISIYTRSGKPVYSNSFNNIRFPLQINTSEFYPDVYILNIRNPNSKNIISRKLIVK
jgi:hypothetical protein